VGKKVKMGHFWEQMEKLGPTNGAWNRPKCLNCLHNPQSFEISLYLPAGDTSTLMKSKEKRENRVFWEQLEEFGPEINPDVSIIFPILLLAKTDVISVLGGQ
jgi:hypothetical protein